MSSIKLTADASGGTVELKAPPTTTSNAAKVITLSQNPGMITQVVSTEIANTAITTSSTSWASMGVSVAITPSSSSNKVLIQMAGGGHYNPTSQEFAYITVYRDSTNIGDATTGLESIYATSSNYVLGPHSLAVLDSPATTSAITYTIYAKVDGGTYQFQQTDRAHIVLYAMEIAG